jgi:surfeit locus 1 family protein
MRFRPTVLATLLTLAALAVLIALGVWQLERRAWKHALVARIADSRAAPPQDLVGMLSASGMEPDYAHVEVDGTIAPDKAIHLFSPEGQGGADYRVIAPLDYGSGRFILVDLGTITEAEKTALKTPVPEAATGFVHVEGLLRPSEAPGWFTAAPDLKGNRWYARDVPAIAAALGLGPVHLYVLQSETPNAGGLPRAVPFQPELSDNHLAYAITWFSFALILLVVYVLFHTRRRND